MLDGYRLVVNKNREDIKINISLVLACTSTQKVLQEKKIKNG